MKIGVPATGPLGDRFEVWTIRDPDDPLTTMKWTMCIYDRDDRLVFMDVISHRVGVDPDIKIYREDISSLRSDVYRVNIYYGDYLLSGCDNAPADQLRYIFYIHKEGSDIVSLRMNSSWYPDRNYIFAMYVLDGIPFYTSTSSRAVSIPRNADVFVEITGSDNNAYVGIVRATSDITVTPNATIPFRAVLRIRLSRPFAEAVANMYANMLGYGRGIVINIIDDYTFDLEFVKTEVGVYKIVALIFIFLMVVILALAAVAIVSMIVSVEHRELDIIQNIINERKKLVEEYKEEYDACTDDMCRDRVQRKYLPIIQGYDAAIGALSLRLSGHGQCNGLNLGGVCVPWWVVGVAVFMAGLLVVSVVRR
jgi:hypothetical protein